MFLDVIAYIPDIFNQVIVVNEPFHSERDSYGLLPIDGVSVHVTFFEESKSRNFTNLFFCARKTLGVSWD